MLSKYELVDGDLTCRNISIDDCNETYVNWLNDKDVNKFLEVRWERQSIDTIKEYAEYMIKSNHSILFAITYGKSKIHIGNIKIGSISEHYHNAEISYFIGKKEYWGKGIATRAIKLVSEYGFNELKLHKMIVGVFDENIGSIKALKKAGFVEEACFKEKLISPINGKFCNHLFFTKNNNKE